MGYLEGSIERFEMYYSQHIGNVADYRLRNPNELIVTFTNGTRLIFCEPENIAYKISSNNTEKSEYDIRLDFSTALRRILYRRDITQKELSELTGISQTTISKYLNRKATPSLYIIDRLTRALGCSINDFNYD